MPKQLRRATGGADDLTALARLELDVVDQGANRDVGDGQAIASANLGARSGHQRVADLEVDRCQDVALLSVGIVKQRQTRGAVRVVLDGRHDGRNAVLLAAKVQNAHLAPVPAAAVTTVTRP